MWNCHAALLMFSFLGYQFCLEIIYDIYWMSIVLAIVSIVFHSSCFDFSVMGSVIIRCI